MNRWTFKFDRSDILKLLTKYFGEIDYEPEDVLTFADGLFGFEDEKSFLLLPFAGGRHRLLCMQSIQTQGLAFVVMDPLALDPDYDPVLQGEELKDLGVSDSRDLGYYVLCMVKNPVAESTVNMRCPVAVNPQTRKSRQVILESDRYHMRHPLAEFGGGEGEASC
jgi:flagellar assembly factor FliW